MVLEVRKENQRILQRRELLRFAQGMRKEHSIKMRQFAQCLTLDSWFF